MGCLLNLVVVITSLRARNVVYKEMQDKLLGFLVFIFFLWSLFSSLRGFMNLFHPVFTIEFVKVLNSLFMIFIFAVNLALGVERYFIVSKASDVERRNGMIAVGFTFFLFTILLIMGYLSLKSDSDAKTNLEVETEISTFFDILQPVILITFWCILILMTCAIYAGTYFVSKRLLEQSLVRRPELIPIYSRKVLGSSFVMGMSIFIAYAPMFIFTLLDSDQKLLAVDRAAKIRMQVANFFLAADVIITPCKLPTPSDIFSYNTQLLYYIFDQRQDKLS
ncbi:hypothetical protein BCR33DRAFT_852773 [Rhizoclosmatium globosum]|uniref:G-protein coupled receptors family 1 profile domain-containing protein n=1 Tax=Rhizoclosmatium globosum TaxID=329046 RepID=A0A1Y2C088_9FUNG|nr:hypothetical protein BCR33DRAFT_852773 [Rhizoclosmatium globosum]|eukprot:ORY40452.1 hypothetical protein BCR33DRAFT_852773 [Rhizoclosmatium globosum]